MTASEHCKFCCQIDMVHGTHTSVEESAAKGTVAVLDIAATQASLLMAPDLMAGKGLGCLECHPALITGPRRD